MLNPVLLIATHIPRGIVNIASPPLDHPHNIRVYSLHYLPFQQLHDECLPVYLCSLAAYNIFTVISNSLQAD